MIKLLLLTLTLFMTLPSFAKSTSKSDCHFYLKYAMSSSKSGGIALVTSKVRQDSKDLSKGLKADSEKSFKTAKEYKDKVINECFQKKFR